MRSFKNRVWALFAQGSLISAFGCGAYSESVDATMSDLGSSGIGGTGMMVGGSGGFGNAGAAAVTLSQGAAYSGTTDATIALEAPTTNLGNLATCTVDAGSRERACAIRWSLAPIPSTATIVKATVMVHVIESSAHTFSVYKLNRRWSEVGITWNKWTSVSSWSLPGAKASTDRDPLPIASFTGALGFDVFEIPPAVVQAWLADPNANDGLLIANEVSTDGIILDSSESDTVDGRPTLTVSYRP